MSGLYVVIKDMSAGNESVGEMWQETVVFGPESTLEDVMNWAEGNDCLYSKKRITITKAHPTNKSPCKAP